MSWFLPWGLEQGAFFGLQQKTLVRKHISSEHAKEYRRLALFLTQILTKFIDKK
jgi:hypothetical protein